MTQRYLSFADGYWADSVKFATGYWQEIAVPVAPPPTTTTGGGAGGLSVSRRRASGITFEERERMRSIQRQNALLTMAFVAVAAGEDEWEH